MEDGGLEHSGRGGRYAWIDAVRGIGMLAVVMGHAEAPFRPVLCWFHMPLFFAISGYLHRPGNDLLGYARKKTKRLMIPYIAWLIVLNAPLLWRFLSGGGQDIRLGSFLPVIYGGRYLEGTCTVFWFITCLYFTSLCWDVVLNKIGANRPKYLLMVSLAAYIIAMINSWYYRDVFFPLAFNIAAMALPFYAAGYFYARYERQINRPVFIGASALCVVTATTIAVAIAFTRDYFPLYFSMKDCCYGDYPFVNVIIALSYIHLCFLAGKVLVARVSSISYVLCRIGTATMGIMYMHPVVRAMLDKYGYENWVVRTVAMMVLSYAVYAGLGRFRLTRQVFLGRFTTRK